MTDTPPPTTDTPPERRVLSMRALVASQRRDWTAVTTHLELMVRTYGDISLGESLWEWVDLTIHVLTGGATEPVQLSPVVMNPGGINAATPEDRFAVRLLAARASMDEPTAMALLDAVPHDQQSRSYLAVLRLCGQILDGRGTAVVTDPALIDKLRKAMP